MNKNKNEKESIMKSTKWFEFPTPKPGENICPLCHRSEADESPQGCHCWDETKKKAREEEYKRTAGIQAPMPGDDGTPPTDTISPMVTLIIIIITIAFFAMLAWGFMIVFGT